VGANDGSLYSVKLTGILNWVSQIVSEIKSSPSIGSDGTVYIGSSDGHLYAINPDGIILWDYETGGEIISSPAIGYGTIYIGSGDGNVYAIGELISSTVEAAFTAVPTNGYAPLEVSFYNLSSVNIKSYILDLGDDKSSNDKNPSHTYNQTGNYTVRLTVFEGAQTDTETKEDYIIVEAPPAIQADFTASPTKGKVPLKVKFTDLSTGRITKWYWEFGDGKTSRLPNPSHFYLKPGTYTVSLTVSGRRGDDKITKEDLVNVEPIFP